MPTLYGYIKSNDGSITYATLRIDEPTFEYDVTATETGLVDIDTSVLEGAKEWVTANGASFDTATKTLTLPFKISGYTDTQGDTTAKWKNGDTFNALNNIYVVGGGGSMTKQVDLTTLTGWANLSDGEHTITIKAKADGYRDSQASEGVQVNKGGGVTSGYTVTIQYSGLSSNLCFYSLDDGNTWIDGYVAGQTQLVLNNVEQIKFKVAADYSHYCAITGQSGDRFSSLYVSNGGSETSTNITLTQDMVVQFAAGID